MGDGLKLEVPLLRILGIVACEGTVDADRVSVMALDEVGIVAVHRTHQVADAGVERGMDTPGERAGAGDKVRA